MSTLSFDGVTKAYGHEPRRRVVLKDISFEIQPRRFVGLWGPRASGKTTLLEIAAGFQPPDSGHVSCQGHELGSLSAKARAHLWRHEICCAHTNWLPAEYHKVRWYLEAPLLSHLSRREAERAAHDALESLDAEHLIDCSWPELSHRERARVALAGAIARRPRLLLADDVAAGLTPIERDEIVTRLRTYVEHDGMTVLMTTRDPSDLVRCDERWSLSEGSLSELSPQPPGDVVELATWQAQTGRDQ